MSSSAEIPFENQMDADHCGAACLCMVYRSFGLDCSQEDVWKQVSRHGRWGCRARTHLLAADALRRGLSALVLQAREPWRLLQRSAATGVRVILNHRPHAAIHAGHYTVLLAVEEDEVVVHDPQAGPNQRLKRESLLRLWQPGPLHSETAGYTLVAIHAPGTGAFTCSTCGTSAPDSVACPSCNQPVTVQPAAVLGCASNRCSQRLWQYLFCPACDHRRSSLLEL